ncbi:hypothetical protein [Campylobacter concisus]|uniref:hypothetical protein n=1 Tax=Campylobacter concisus TaxID=199 RepID=UPI00122D4AB9|nr:hypothetical protein [Campylobacter concisus]
MVRKIAIFTAFSVFAYAFSLQTSASALSNVENVQISLENLDQNGSLNVNELVLRLKQSSSYDSISFSSNSLNLKFISEQKVPSTLFVKSINSTLDDANISISRINSLKNGDQISYGISAIKNGGIDPSLLSLALSQSGFKILGFDRVDGNLEIFLDAQNMILKATKVNFDEETPLLKSGGTYFVDVEGASSLDIASKESNRWMPLVRIYDKNLNQIDSIKEEQAKTTVSINLAIGAKYALISDNVDINNIKNEIIIKLIK